jgi:hypothetical protein
VKFIKIFKKKKSSKENRIFTVKMLESTVSLFRLLSGQDKKNAKKGALLVDHKTRILLLFGL